MNRDDVWVCAALHGAQSQCDALGASSMLRPTDVAKCIAREAPHAPASAFGGTKTLITSPPDARMV